MTLSPRARLAARIAGYVLLGLITFVYALHLTFPYERVRDRMIETLAAKYDVAIGGVKRSVVPGRFSLTSVTLRSRPSVAGQPVTTMFFKEIEVDVAFLPLLKGTAEIGLDVNTGGGHLSGVIRASKTSLNVDFRLKRVPLSTIPGIADAVGLPLGGGGDGHVTLDLPKGDWTKATGKVNLSCTVGCTVGDDVSRVYPKAKREADQLMVKDGFVVKTISVGRFVLGIRIAKGEAKLDAFEFQSPDGEIAIDFSIKLAKKMNDSVITGCIRYKCAADYQAKSPAACDLGSPVVDRDGFHNIKLAGKLGTMKRLGAVCDAGGGGGAADDGGDVFSNGGVDKSNRGRPSLDAIAPAPVIDAGVPPIEMGRPMPMADDVNRGGGEPTNTGAGGASGAPIPDGNTGIVAPPPPPPPGVEAPRAEPIAPQGDGASGGSAYAPGTTGSGGPPPGTETIK